MILASLHWFNSVPHATLVLAGATLILAIVAVWSAIEGHRAAQAAGEAAKAAEKQAVATAQSVTVAEEALAHAHRPVLTDVPLRKYGIYGLPNDALKITPGSGSTTFCQVPLQNVGTGTAVIEHEEPCPAAQVRLNSQWYRGEVNALVLPVGETIEFEVQMPIVPTDDTNTNQAATIYVRVAYADLVGNRFVTYLCLMLDERSDSIEHADLWSVHGVAFDEGRGGLVQSGEGWTGFNP